MNEDLSRFRDPLSGEPLHEDGETLVNPQGQSYPVLNSIPRFVPAENYAFDFGAQWNRFPGTQLDSRNGLTISEDRLARCFRGELPAIKGRRVLEAGSGAGRFTEVLLKHGAGASFALAQADIRAMPFPRASYEFVACIGVLQHTPDTEESIGKLWEMVAPGGRLIIDHYAWNLWLALPPPLGDAEKFYRWFILRLPQKKRFGAVKALVDFWFPIHWATRRSRWAKRILSRISGIHFYFLDFDLKTKERYYEWSLLDTHDGMTDAHKRHRDTASIAATLEKLGAVDIEVWQGGNGVEAWCRKPGAPA